MIQQHFHCWEILGLIAQTKPSLIFVKCQKKCVHVNKLHRVLPRFSQNLGAVRLQLSITVYIIGHKSCSQRQIMQLFWEPVLDMCLYLCHTSIIERRLATTIRGLRAVTPARCHYGVRAKYYMLRFLVANELSLNLSAHSHSPVSHVKVFLLFT